MAGEPQLLGAVAAVAAATGAHLLWSAASRPVRPARPSLLARTEQSARRWLLQAGLDDVAVAEFAGVMVALFLVGSVLTYAVFGGAAPSTVAGAFLSTVPAASYRHRQQARQAKAQDAWPRMIEEVRLLTSSLGRSIPQALFEVGRRGPAELRPAFAAANREWLLSTDFGRTLRVLKDRLVDPTADAACETLLVAHQLGGADLDRRLAALADDRRQDAQGRKDARSRQAGVRFARRFVLIVPIGMAAAGLAIGDGRSAYATPLGQVLVLAGIGMTAACWLWAGRILRLPQEQRVFVE